MRAGVVHLNLLIYLHARKDRWQKKISRTCRIQYWHGQNLKKKNGWTLKRFVEFRVVQCVYSLIFSRHVCVKKNRQSPLLTSIYLPLVGKVIQNILSCFYWLFDISINRYGGNGTFASRSWSSNCHILESGGKFS